MSGPDETVLAFDFGPRRTGVAVGNGITRTARPLAVIDDASADGRFAAIARLVDEWRPQRLVVGVPREPEPDADESPSAAGRGAGLLMTERCERFARQLAGRFGLPVATVDERFTSREAAVRMREAGGARRAGGRRGHAGSAPDDAWAAALILEQWFNDGA